MKKGQLTIFIIIGILIIGFVLLFYFVLNNEKKDKEPVYVEASSVFNFVQDCLDMASEQALYLIGLHGGYFIPPEESTYLGVPYYFYDSQLVIPSKKKIELEISLLVENLLPICLDEFESFPEFDIDKGEIKVTTTIEDDSVFVNLNYLIRVRKGESVSLLEKFNAEVPIRLDTIYSACEFILDYESKNPGEICLNCMLDFQNENDLQINTQSIDTTLIYEIVDKESTLDLNNDSEFEPENYKFSFAIKY